MLITWTQTFYGIIIDSSALKIFCKSRAIGWLNWISLWALKILNTLILCKWIRFNTTNWPLRHWRCTLLVSKLLRHIWNRAIDRLKIPCLIWLDILLRICTLHILKRLFLTIEILCLVIVNGLRRYAIPIDKNNSKIKATEKQIEN